MQILLDDKPCEVEAANVGEAIDAAAGLAEGDGRLIVDVVVDGNRWPASELFSPQRRAATAGIVRLTTADPVSLVRTVLSDAANALADADALQREAAKLLQAGEAAVAMPKLEGAISIWLSVQQAIVKGTELLGLDLGSVTAGDVPAAEVIESLTGRLHVVRQALAERDPIGLADTLLYELPVEIERWQALLAGLVRRLG